VTVESIIIIIIRPHRSNIGNSASCDLLLPMSLCLLDTLTSSAKTTKTVEWIETPSVIYESCEVQGVTY